MAENLWNTPESNEAAESLWDSPEAHELAEVIEGNNDIDDSSTVLISKKQAKKEDTECFENRELSWLRFNERVLEEAEDLANPLCERLQFLSIFQTNLDEFFMVRVGSLHDQMLVNNNLRENKTFLSPEDQIEAVSKRVRKLEVRFGEAYKNLMLQLETYGIHLVDFASLKKDEAAYLEKFFKTAVLPLLSPIIVGKKQPFPFLTNQQLYTVCSLQRKGEKDKIGIVPCAREALPRLIAIPSHKGEYMLLEELVLHFLPLVFNKYAITEKAVIRITRNADIDADNAYDEDLDYRELMEELVKSRRRLCPIRLEYNRPVSTKLICKLCDYLDLDYSRAFYNTAPLDLSFFSVFKSELYNEKQLFFEKRQPQRSGLTDEALPMIPQIQDHDILLYYPFERMNPVIRLLEEAAKDPDVISIKMTLYRLAKNSQVIAALVAASEAGKQVDVLVELKARFDEENNIHWSHMLEDAGCHVLYGLGKYKVHSKLLLITKKNGEEIEYITQIGTGNYNENTARLYTDFALMTANREIGEDANNVFRALCLGEIPDGMQTLLVSPLCLQPQVLQMMDREIEEAKAGRPAYIGLKLNSLTDKRIILKLIEASQAGVQVDMVIRGINCLRSGVPEKTDNIRVLSIVGRYLEHARVYIFGTAEREKMYISSADFMTRNTLRRVEVGCPVFDEKLREKIHHIFEMQLRDNTKTRRQRPGGSYKKVKRLESEELLNSQERLFEEAYNGTL